MSTITIPYKPRHQWAGNAGIHARLSNSRFSVLVAHRRFGKTVGVINQILRVAITTERTDGRYGYIAPYRNQAKSIAWDYLKRYSSVLPGIKINEGDLSIDYSNGSRIRLFGADNADALRGLYFDGVVLDEIADMRPEVWGEIIRPALSDRKGWAIFIGTPKGQNVFFELYQQSLNSVDWYSGMFRADETGVIDAEELEALRTEMSENQFKQEFLCDFTAATDDALIPIDIVLQAQKKEVQAIDYDFAPLVFGVDIARFGSDESVVFMRRGLKAFDCFTFKSIDNMLLAGKVSELIDKYKPQTVFVDAGRGEGVIDRLRQVGYRNIIEVGFGTSPLNAKYRNKRCEMWDLMGQWMKVGSIPSDSQLSMELSLPGYFFDASNKLCLEKKEDIKKRCGFSPDRADALALTFAFPVKNMNDPLFRQQTARIPRMGCM